MRQGFTVDQHFVDPNGAPEGGHTCGVGFAIAWQRGPLGRGADRIPPNGAFVEDVIAAAASRITFYQDGRFACEENAAALRHLKEALFYLERRTNARLAQGVEGTHGLHATHPISGGSDAEPPVLHLGERVALLEAALPDVMDRLTAIEQRLAALTTRRPAPEPQAP